MRIIAIAAVVLLFAACAPQNNPQPMPPGPAPSNGYEPAPADPGPSNDLSCLTGADCESGVCEGMGCGDDQPGRCVTEDRRCTRDYAAYCGCDGQTFHGSGSCPGARYSAKGECANP
jgi:hypothetical protein